jgi:DNA-binding CsgD family transcriptional regulator
VFDQARGYAYAEWRRLHYPDADRLLAAVYEYSMNINAGFHTPMIDREVLCIARSITRWTSRHMTAEGMSAWGEAGRCKSIITRQAKAAGMAAEIRTFYDSRPDVTREELALIFDVSPSTIKDLDLPLIETRKEARRSKADQRAEEIREYKAAHPNMSNRDIGAALGVSRKTVNNAVKSGKRGGNL